MAKERLLVALVMLFLWACWGLTLAATFNEWIHYDNIKEGLWSKRDSSGTSTGIGTVIL